MPRDGRLPSECQYGLSGSETTGPARAIRAGLRTVRGGRPGERPPARKAKGTAMRLSTLASRLAAASATLWFGGAALAQETLEHIGKPVDRGLHMQPAATEVARDIVWLDTFVLVIITLISVFVVGLLLFVIVRFGEKTNPKPATFTHNSTVEVAWTVIPVMILILIGALSLPKLFKQMEIPEPGLTIKVTGNQWYWSYEYPDDGVAFDAQMIGNAVTVTDGDLRLTDAVREKLKESGYTEDEFLLATDTAVVVPVDTVVRLQITGSDVIHSWAMPAFGVKLDAVPGRLQETWFKADLKGVFFGQCSELCGKDHAYMPITVKVVSAEDYAAWLGATTKAAGLPAPVRVAAN
jgi:cytochrome c oxidase subunit 2